MIDNYKKELRKNGKLILHVKIRPGAGKSTVRQILPDGTLKIDVKDRAERGKANRELTGFLAKEFEISPNNVKIIAGNKVKTKIIKITATK